MRAAAAFAVIALVACSHAPPPAAEAPPPAAEAPPPQPPSVVEPAIAFQDGALAVISHGVYADPAMTSEQRDVLRRDVHDATDALAAFFGARSEPPTLISCVSDACALKFAGPTRRSHASMDGGARIVVNGIGPLTTGTIVHEMIHVEIARRRGKAALPAWFDEGVATFIGDNVRCPAGTRRAIDDLRRLDAPRAWEGFTNMTGTINPAYCQARDEIGAWVGQHSRSALLDVVTAVASGTAFDIAYGPLVTRIPSEQFSHAIVGSFALDENHGTDAADDSGRSRIGSLMVGATWTVGHRGAAVKVLGGSYVRGDGFAELGVPDSPFSISLWVKPLANANVLVHAALQPSGGDGWCNPILGHDDSGHLVAQVGFARDPKAFLTATGPVLPLHAWSHVAITWQAADGVHLYVNGAEVATAAPKTDAEHHRLAPAAPVYLLFGSDHGARCWSPAIHTGDWNGAIDDLRVFDYALTAEQVRADSHP